LPWLNVNEVSIAFSEDVVVQADDLDIRGVIVATYATDPAAFTYNAGARTATWRLPAGVAFQNDKILLDLNSDSPAGVRTAAGAYLDGNWSNGTDAYPSGDGSPGDDFRFRFNMLPGDTTRDGSVLARDYADVKKKFFKNNPRSLPRARLRSMEMAG
jgi:hypothetical protein